MERDNLRWFGGPITHMHIRLPSEPNNVEDEENLQFTHKTAIHYLSRLYGNPNIRITDTAHALLSFRDLDNLRRPALESSENWKKRIIIQASLNTMQRVSEMKRLANDNIIIGIEADIIDNQGHLSLNNECLQQVDFTIASFHRFIWTIFSEKTHYSHDDLVSMYLGALDNSSVCVLGHTIRPSTKRVGSLQFEDFLPLIKKMKKKRIAYEINPLVDLSDEQESLNLQVIKECSRVGTPLIFGFDFHSTEDLEFLNNIPIGSDSSEGSSLDHIFSLNSDIHFRVFRRLIKNIQILKDLGVNKGQIVNSTDQKFDQWLRERKSIS